MNEPPVELRPTEEVAELAAEVVDRFRSDIAGVVDGEVHHVGASAMPFGHTKGDVDVNLRVAGATLPEAVSALGSRYAVAQPENWTATFVSFTSDAYELPFGIQVTVVGSRDDVLLALHEHIRSSPDLVQAYDEVKLAAAPQGRTAYWEAKNAFLQGLLHEIR